MGGAVLIPNQCGRMQSTVGSNVPLGRAGVGRPELWSRESKQAGLHAFLSALVCGRAVACCVDPLPL